MKNYYKYKYKNVVEFNLNQLETHILSFLYSYKYIETRFMLVTDESYPDLIKFLDDRTERIKRRGWFHPQRIGKKELSYLPGTQMVYSGTRDRFQGGNSLYGYDTDDLEIRKNLIVIPEESFNSVPKYHVPIYLGLSARKKHIFYMQLGIMDKRGLGTDCITTVVELMPALNAKLIFFKPTKK